MTVQRKEKDIINVNVHVYKIAVLVFKSLNQSAPKYLQEIVTPTNPRETVFWSEIVYARSVFRLVTVQRKEKDIINVNVYVYCPDIAVRSADCTVYTPGIGTHSVTVSSPLGTIHQSLST